MVHAQSELQVIAHAKKLYNYMMTITQKPQKQFCFSLIGRMQESYGCDPEVETKGHGLEVRPAGNILIE